MMFIDVHCHLDLLKDISGVVQRAEKAGVGKMITAGVDYETNRKVMGYVEEFDSVLGALGVYPIDGLKMSKKGLEEEINFIRKNKDKIVAIGEVGLDFKKSEDLEDKKRQEEIFIKFINLSKELDKVLIVHSRKAEERCIEILERLMTKKVVMHCFCGKKKLVERIIENGWLLSIPGNVNYSHQFQEIVTESEIGSLLCETDSPFLHPFRKRDNEPKNVIESYKKIAELKNMGLSDVEMKVEANFSRLFGQV